MKSIVSALMVTLILVSTFTLAFNVRPVKASGTICIRADGSIDPPTASIATTDNVTYTFTQSIYDSIVVERSSIIVDGAGYTLQGSGSGSGFVWSGINNVTIGNTNIRDFDYGIYLSSSSGSCVSGNNITANNYYGIWLYFSSNTSISGNAFTDDGLHVAGSYQNSVENNTVNGRPLVYLEGVSNYTVEDAGQVILIKCENIRVEGLNLSRTAVGIELYETGNSTISGNNITNNGYGIYPCSSSNNSISGNNIASNGFGILLSWSSNYNSIQGNNITNNSRGIYLYSSSNNSISGNNITNNEYGIGLGLSSDNNKISGNNITNNACGIWLDSSSNNTIYHNNFINNTDQVDSVSASNFWDDGYPSGGNYWSDYTGIDVKSGPDQDHPGSDGIGDAPYVLDSNNHDRYPLMKPYPWVSHDLGITSLDVSKTVVGQGYTVDVNVTMFNYGDNTEIFNVTVYANTTVIHTFENITLASRNSSTVTFVWDTNGFVRGNYTLNAVADPVPGETDTADNTFNRWVFVTLAGDVDGNRQVNIFDIVKMAGVYGVKLPDPRYQPNCDIDGDGDVDIFDIVIAAGNYGKHW